MAKKKQLQHQSGIANYAGLYGDRLGNPDGGYLFTELLESRSAKFGWDIQPHIHPGILQVFFVEKGTFDLYESEQTRQLTGPALLFIPSAALHGFVFNESVAGRIVTIAQGYYDALWQGQHEVSLAPEQVTCITAFHQPDTAGRIANLLAELDQEIYSQEPGKVLMLQTLLQQLFLLIYRLQDVRSERNITAPAAYFKRFQQLMRQSGDGADLNELASKMAITPIHLNRISKAVSGKPASKVMQEYLIGEAKKYLRYTSHSVAEIAYLLKFNYPNYFARFFKKHTGMAPLEYRNSNNAND
jgi:AraC family transcriptional activator of pobA